MNRIFLVSFVLIFTSLTPVLSQYDREEKERNWIRNNHVKAKEQWDYKYEGEKPSRQGFMSSKVMYDKNGRITEVINYKNNGSVVNISSYAFDPQGNQQEFIKYVGNKEKMTYRQTYTYDSNGNKLIETGYNGAEDFRNSYTYNELGKLSVIQYYLADKLDETRLFKYTGDKLEVNVSDALGALKFKLQNKLNTAGNVLETVKIDKGGNILEKTIYTYNEQALLSFEEKWVKGVYTEKLSYKYTPDGNLSELWTELSSGEKYMKNSYGWREDGRILEEKWRTSPSADFSYKKYNYDPKGRLLSIDSYYASYKYRVLNKFSYK
jgi:hypothetical protein